MKGGINKMKIKHKLLVAFGLLIVMAFIIVGTNLLTYETMESDANFVNHSGKLRATSYKMAQLSNVIVASKNDQTSKVLEDNFVCF